MVYVPCSRYLQMLRGTEMRERTRECVCVACMTHFAVITIAETIESRSNRVDDRPFKHHYPLLPTSSPRQKTPWCENANPRYRRPRQIWPVCPPDSIHLPPGSSVFRRSFVTLHASRSYYFVRRERPVYRILISVYRATISSRSRVIRHRCAA